MISVLVVDDQSLIRQAVENILANEDDMEVSGGAVNGREALTLIAEQKPDVVLMDIRMPELDGIATTAAICANPALEGTRVLIFTTFEEDRYVVAALRAGASGFIGKGSEPEDLVRAVRTIHAGESLFSAAATRALISRYATPQASAKDLQAMETLTEREAEILLLVARGMTNQEIADTLIISPHTVKTHVNRIMVKLKAHDRAQLVVFAYENGLHTPGS